MTSGFVRRPSGGCGHRGLGVPSALAAQAAPARGGEEAVTPDWAGGRCSTSQREVKWSGTRRLLRREVQRVVEAFEARYPDIDVETVRCSPRRKRRSRPRCRRVPRAPTSSRWPIVTLPRRSDTDGLSPLPAAGPHLAAWEGTDSLLTDDTSSPTTCSRASPHNTDLVSESLTSYEDLLLHESPTGRSACRSPRRADRPPSGSTSEKHMGAEFVEALAEREPRVHETGAPMDQALIAR